MLQRPVAGFREGMSPFLTQSPRHISQQAWCPPSPRNISQQAWCPPSPRNISLQAWCPPSPRNTSQQAWCPPSPRNISQQAWCPPSPRNISQQAWCPPAQHWHARNGAAPQSNRSPHYNSCPSSNGHWSSPQQWSPNGWEQVSKYRRSWGTNPRTPLFSPHYKHSPEHVPVYNGRKDGKGQVNFKHKRGNPKDISNYYSPSMIEDPWADLQAKAPEITVPTC
ncbi:uncharacterized protein LOC142160459 [Mixophyes fleayi]|uniref:uncharacterized protein LOC142160459 n=1 Tax=Mixophyes fleayi TaxID=3061075 RepID=UPI003F4D8A6F